MSETEEKVKGTILIIDDEYMIRELLSSTLSREGYTCMTAGSTEEGLSLLMQNEVDLTLLDIMMPGMSGFEFLPHLKATFPDTAVLMVTAVSDVETALSCIQMGADDFVVKPFSIDRIMVTAHNILEKRRLTLENRDYQNKLEQKVREQTQQIKEAMEDLNRSYEYTLSALVRALDAREKEVGSHSERVMNYTLLLARKWGMKESDLEIVAKGTLLHDIGKIGVPDNILLKGSGLNQTEWKEMKKHPVVGSEILSGIKSFQAASDFVLSHHERYDGTGYPHGLKGKDIPIGARIFTLAETLDAMTSDRPYRKALPFANVIKEVKKCSGTQFDPELADLFLTVPRKTWEDAGKKTFL